MATHVSLILMEDVESLGFAGDEVHVAPGYARNYLLPKGLAAKSTPGTLRLLAARKEKIEAKRAAELSAARELGDKLSGLEISITAQAADDDQLFGSVTARGIAERLAENGIVIDHKHIKLDTPIKNLGSYTVDVKLHSQVVVPLKVVVTRG